MKKPVAMITGASSGIGAASARAFARLGYSLALGARRVERMRALAAELERELGPASGASVFVERLDVTERDSCERFVARALDELGTPAVLLNNAGLAASADRLVDSKESDWRAMLDTNVVGVLRMTQLVLPRMIAADAGHVIMLGSYAAHMAYEGGSVYCASKAALRLMTQSIRLELLGTRVRVSSIDPGMVETEFSIVRLGDVEKAKKVYAGMDPLTAEDIADCITWVATRPPHVDIDEMVIKPVAQAAMGKIHRRT